MIEEAEAAADKAGRDDRIHREAAESANREVEEEEEEGGFLCRRESRLNLPVGRREAINAESEKGVEEEEDDESGED